MSFKKIIVIFVSITIVFYWRLIFQDKILFPGDLLVGAYFPWMQLIPVKNPLISDIFSQFHIWKSLIAESLARGEWPLWNPYMYSGYPLLANFNSGALNPFNILMIIFGDAKGWNYLIMTQTLGCLISFYLYMRVMKISKEGSIIASIIYAFSGFAITWLPFVNVGFSFIWIALMLYFTEKKRFLLLSPLIFLLTVSGHFQALIYGLILIGFYFLYREKFVRNYFWFFISMILGILMSTVQMLPTLEFMNRSIRFSEGYIASYSYGLLPIQNLVTFLAPDFFGNASTGNYWGPFNYHETIIYAGIFAIMSLVGAIYNFKKLGNFRFFLFSFIISILLIFDTPIGRLPFEKNVPLISTSAAGRISLIIALSLSALSGWWFDRLKRLKFSEVIRFYWWWMLAYLILFVISFASFKLFLPHIAMIPEWVERAKIAWRNLVIPGFVSSLFLFAFLFSRKANGFFILVLLITLFDLFRFGWKYLPFVNSEYLYPENEITNYLISQEGVFRIDREQAQILPPNTWVNYRLQSPSGYDPMAVESYVGRYQEVLNSDANKTISRYSELSEYDAKRLGEWNVKYLVAIRRDEHNEIKDNTDDFFYKISKADWTPVFSSKDSVVLENKFYQERARLLNTEGRVNIREYSPEEVIIDYEAQNSGELILMDTNYPGWKAYVNGDRRKIENHDEVFRKVKIDSGKGTVIFSYRPESFYWGLRISLLAFLIWLMIYKYTTKPIV